MANHLSDKEVRDIFEKRWTLDCPRMQLVQQDSEDVIFHGAGAIRFSEDGPLEFVLYDTTTEVPVERLFGGVTLAAGEWLSAENFYTLRATDFHERVWTAEWLDAGTTSRAGVAGAVVRGNVSELRLVPPNRGAMKSISLFAKTSREIPTNAFTTVRTNIAGSESESFSRNVWTVETSIGSLQAVRDGNILNLRIGSEEPIVPTDAALRLEEALSIVLGEQIRWSVEQEGEPNGTIVIRDVREQLRRPRLRPPIEFTNLADVRDVGLLFDCLLAHLIRTRPAPDRRHSLAVAVLNVLRASSSVLEDEALAVSVQVESVVRAQFTDLGKPDATTIARVEEMLTHVHQWDGDDAFRDRVLKLIGNIKGASAESALKALAASGLIEERHWIAWRALRHPSAHGAVRQIDVRRTVAQCDIVFDLLLRMIFRIIGYAGQYSDHTQGGWPLRQAPTLGAPSVAQGPTSQDDTVLGETSAQAADPISAEPEVVDQADEEADAGPDLPH